MTFHIWSQGEQKIAEWVAEGEVIQSAQDALDVMAEARSEGADSLIWRQEQLSAAFFDLRSGLAGDILQKFANYHMRLAVVGEFAELPAGSFRAFVVECNRGRMVCFVPDVATAVARLGLQERR